MITASGLEKQFVEKKKNELFSFLKKKLENSTLQFNVVVEEKSGDRPQIEVPLSSREQFNKMCEMYPMVKELKDRLRLELDY